MFELLEQILNNLDFSINNNSDNTIDVLSHNVKGEPKVLEISLSGDEKGGQRSPSQPESTKKPQGDSEICKFMTDRVIEMQKQAKFNPISTLEHVDEHGRKHVAVAGSVKLPVVGDKTISGCVSFPALVPASDKK